MRLLPRVVGLLLVTTFALGCDSGAKKRKRAVDDTESERSSSEPVRSKTDQCNEVVQAINTHLETIQGFDGKSDFEGQAKKLEAFEKRLGEMKVADGELKKHLDAYRKMLTEFAQLSRDLGDPSKLEGADKRSDAISKTEGKLVDEINAYCRP